VSGERWIPFDAAAARLSLTPGELARELSDSGCISPVARGTVWSRHATGEVPVLTTFPPVRATFSGGVPGRIVRAPTLGEVSVSHLEESDVDRWAADRAARALMRDSCTVCGGTGRVSAGEHQQRVRFGISWKLCPRCTPFNAFPGDP
jgi:hypothetical protein